METRATATALLLHKGLNSTMQEQGLSIKARVVDFVVVSAALLR